MRAVLRTYIGTDGHTVVCTKWRDLVLHSSVSHERPSAEIFLGVVSSQWISGWEANLAIVLYHARHPRTRVARLLLHHQVWREWCALGTFVGRASDRSGLGEPRSQSCALWDSAHQTLDIKSVRVDPFD